MRKLAAAWNCRDTYCLPGLMDVPQDRTRMHSGICGENHKSASINQPLCLTLKTQTQKLGRGIKGDRNGGQVPGMVPPAVC